MKFFSVGYVGCCVSLLVMVVLVLVVLAGDKKVSMCNVVYKSDVSKQI